MISSADAKLAVVTRLPLLDFSRALSLSSHPLGRCLPHTSPSQAAPKFKGKISRVLAAKCALSIRVDALGDTSEATIGVEDRIKVEERLRQLEGKSSGALNKDAKAKGKLEKYTGGDAEAGDYNDAADSTLASKKKRKADDDEDAGEKKKKKKKKDEDEGEEDDGEKKKKKKKEEKDDEGEDDGEKKKKKKKKKKDE